MDMQILQALNMALKGKLDYYFSPWRIQREVIWLLCKFKVSLDNPKKVNANFALLVNPFMADVFNDDLPIPRIFVPETSAGWTEVLESREMGSTKDNGSLSLQSNFEASA